MGRPPGAKAVTGAVSTPSVDWEHTLPKAAKEREGDEHTVRAQILRESERPNDFEHNVGSGGPEHDGGISARCGYTEPSFGHSFGDHEPMTREASNKDPDWPDAGVLTDEELGLFPCDREELDRLLAIDLKGEWIGMTEDEAATAILHAFPGAELVHEDHASTRPAVAQDNCFCCGASVTPAPASVEHGWSTVCRTCSEAGR